METGERRLGMGPETRRRLVVIGGAVAMTALLFGLIFAVFAWLPYPAFAVWLRMSHRWKVVAGAVYFLSIFSSVVWFTVVRQRTGKLSGRR
jgi:hypothetical protein